MVSGSSVEDLVREVRRDQKASNLVRCYLVEFEVLEIALQLGEIAPVCWHNLQFDDDPCAVWLGRQKVDLLTCSPTTTRTG